MRARRNDVEALILNELETKLLKQDLCQEFCEEFTKVTNEVRKQKLSQRALFGQELQKRLNDDRKLIDLVLSQDFEDVGALKEKRTSNLARIKELESLISDHPEIPPLLHPSMATHYRKNISKLISAYHKMESHEQALAVLRELVTKIVITPIPGSDSISVDIHGNLATILEIATGKARESEEVLTIAAQINMLTSCAVGQREEVSNAVLSGANDHLTSAGPVFTIQRKIGGAAEKD